MIALSKKSKLLIVVEDHNQFGGLGSQISQVLSEKNPTKIISVHSNDKFGTTGLPDENLEYLGLSARKIFEKIIKNMSKKNKFLITGTSSGIGKETAKLLLSKKFKVIGLSRSKSKIFNKLFSFIH